MTQKLILSSGMVLTGTTMNLTQKLSSTRSGMSLRPYLSWFCTTLFCLIGCCGYAQNQKVADSLVKIYQDNNLQGTKKLQLLSDISFNEVENPGLAVVYAEELIAEASAA